MIPKRFIMEWAKFVPWQEQVQVEQDLIITRALLAIYGNEYLHKHLAFRGGTALNKLFFQPAIRYSEDIDLVQTIDEPIGHTIDLIRSVMDFWLGEPKRSFSSGGVTLAYKTISDDGFPIRLKIEINNCEYFMVLGFIDRLFQSASSWHGGETIIGTFEIEELLGTKLRALYQRRKGRDLFDLYKALTELKDIDTQKIVHCFHEYVRFEGAKISQKLFLDNMESKMQNKEFCGDMDPLLPLNSHRFSPHLAYEYVRENLLEKI